MKALEAIITDLKMALHHIIKEHPENGVITMPPQHAQTLLNAIEDRWVPVSERMPEFNESVLVFCRVYGRFLATYEHIGDFESEKFGNWRDFKGDLGILPPTHWMPLPTPPKG